MIQYSGRHQESYHKLYDAAPAQHITRSHLCSQLTGSVIATLHIANLARLRYWNWNPFADAVIEPATGASLEYEQFSSGPDNADGIQATANEMGRLTPFNLPQTMSRTEKHAVCQPQGLASLLTDLRIVIKGTGSWMTNESPP
jgi:hypothetical protein